MKTSIAAVCLLLTAVAALPGASAEAPPAGDDVAECAVLDVGVSCSHGLGSGCLDVMWGVHRPGLVVGGYDSCNATVWADADVAVGAGAAAPCDVRPTWPVGHAACTVAGVTVGCVFWTGPEAVPDVSCGVDGLPLEASAAQAAPCSGPNPTDVTCTTPAGACTVFLNRWSYAGCQTVLPCLQDPATVSWGRLMVHADGCGAGFDLVG